MSISRLSTDELGQVISFLPVEDAHAYAGTSRAMNQVVHTPRFAILQLYRLFPGQTFPSPVDEYQKIVRIFANFAAVRCGYSIATEVLPMQPAAFPSQISILGSFKVLTRLYATTPRVHVFIMGRGWDIGQIHFREHSPSPYIRAWHANISPTTSYLSTMSEAGVIVFRQRFQADQPRAGLVWVTQTHVHDTRLDFSLAPEEILFGLADTMLRRPKEDVSVEDSEWRFQNSLGQQDKDAIYHELSLLNRYESEHYYDYARLAFESSHSERCFHVSNKDRVEAILHYSMRLIARRYAAPLGDPLAETLFNRLPAALRNPVYGELLAIKRPPQGEDVWNYGELAFHGRLGKTATNLERRAAILNFVDKCQNVL